MEELMKEWLERYRQVCQRTVSSVRTAKDKAAMGPCRLLSTRLFNPLATSMKRDFHSLRKSISSDQDVRGSQRSTNWWIWDIFWWQRNRKWRTSRACQESVYYPIRQSCSCIRASRLMTVSSKWQLSLRCLPRYYYVKTGYWDREAGVYRWFSQWHHQILKSKSQDVLNFYL